MSRFAVILVLAQVPAGETCEGTVVKVPGRGEHTIRGIEPTDRERLLVWDGERCSLLHAELPPELEPSQTELAF